jgi:integrase
MPSGLPLIPNGSEWVVETRSARNLLGSVRGQRGYAWAVAKAKLPHRTFHSLRKSCATELERAGCPQGLISAILGHSGGSVTRLYIHNDAEMMRHYLEKVCLAVRGVQSGVQGLSEPGQHEGESA